MTEKIDEKFLNRLCCRITIRLGKAAKYGEIQNHELNEVCTYILVSFESMKTSHDVMSLFHRLTYRWPFFEDLLEKYYPQYAAVNNGLVDKTYPLPYDDYICPSSSTITTKTKSAAGLQSVSEKQSKTTNFRKMSYRKSVPTS